MFIQALRSLKPGARLATEAVAEAPPPVVALPPSSMPLPEERLRAARVAAECAQLNEAVAYTAGLAAWAYRRADAHAQAAAGNPLAAANLNLVAAECDQLAQRIAQSAARLDMLRALLGGARVVPMPEGRQ